MVVVVIPDTLPRSLDLLFGLELGVQERGEKVGGAVARSNVDPSILVHLAAEELAAVSTLFADYFGAVDVGGVINNETPPSPQVKFLVS